jgi:hypothetical protein
MRIKHDKILVHTCLEIRLPNKSMPPLGTFVAYWLHLSLSSCCIEDWAFSEKSIYFIAIIFSILFHLHLYTTKTQKHFYLSFPAKLANQYPSNTWVWQPFIYLKGTTIDLLHLGVINHKHRCPIPFISSILAISETWSSVSPYLVQSRYRHCHLLIPWYSIPGT